MPYFLNYTLCQICLTYEKSVNISANSSTHGAGSPVRLNLFPDVTHQFSNWRVTCEPGLSATIHSNTQKVLELLCLHTFIHRQRMIYSTTYLKLSKGKSIQNNAFSFMSSSHDNIYTHIRVVQIWGNIYIHLNVWYYWCPKTSTLVSIGSKSTLVSNGWMHSFALISLNNMSLSSVSIGTC